MLFENSEKNLKLKESSICKKITEYSSITFMLQRYEKLKDLLTKMDSVVLDYSQAANQKRLHREHKAFCALEKLYEESLSKFNIDDAHNYSDNNLNSSNNKSASNSNKSNKYNHLLDSDCLVLPDSESEFNNLLSYISDLNENIIRINFI